jgi:hypothetical protein
MVERDADTETVYAPVFTFRDANGMEHTIHSDAASNPPKYQVGDNVRILYSPHNPEAAKTDGFFSLWGVPFVTGLLAAFHLPAGLIVWHWPRLKQRFGFN